MSETVMVRSGWEDLGKLILRLSVAVLLGFHGLAKIKGGIAWMSGPLAEHHIPSFVAYGVYVAEVVAPILLLLGILTRPAALVIAFDMCMAIFLVVKSKAFEINPRGGGLGAELELMFLLTSLAIFFLGSGRIAVSRGQGRWN
ncbi:MAG TPA: DoxX family protein [Gemmatimonadaceae bacterium]|nr:DoxX family protein [Gemmatimonadaceae bacterium]